MHSDLCTVTWGSSLQVELLQDSRANQGIDVATPWLTYSTVFMDIKGQLLFQTVGCGTEGKEALPSWGWHSAWGRPQMCPVGLSARGK